MDLANPDDGGTAHSRASLSQPTAPGASSVSGPGQGCGNRRVGPNPTPPPFREGRCLPQKAGDGTWSSRASDAVDSFADTTRFGATDDNDNRHLDAASRRRSVLLAAPFYTHGH